MVANFRTLLSNHVALAHHSHIFKLCIDFKTHINLGGWVYHLFTFLHMGLANLPTIRGKCWRLMGVRNFSTTNELWDYKFKKKI